jgi:hypothetical protein
VQALPSLEGACSSFAEDAGAVQSKLDQHKQLQTNHSQLLELLEVPQLMDTCVRNSNYDEALDLEAFIAKMAFLHPELDVIAGLHAEVKAIAQAMLSQLLARLSGSIQLPECLRVIGFLRRLSAFSEPELRLKFLQCREQWLVEMVSELDNRNPYDYLKVRNHSYLHGVHAASFFSLSTPPSPCFLVRRAEAHRYSPPPSI